MLVRASLFSTPGKSRSPQSCVFLQPVDIRRKFEGLMPSIDGAVPLSSLVLTALDASGRPCQPVIVFASLVNRPANLGGLARTCEVFRAQCLVVKDLAVKVHRCSPLVLRGSVV